MKKHSQQANLGRVEVVRSRVTDDALPGERVTVPTADAPAATGHDGGAVCHPPELDG